MNKRFLIIIIIVILAIVSLGAILMSGSFNNNEPSDSSDWEVKELAGVKFKVPEKYAGGATMSGNIIDGVPTGNSYESNDLMIRVDDDNWTEQLNKHENSDNVMTLLSLDGKEVKTFQVDGKSIAFFEFANHKITLTWSGDEASGDIKAIIASFFTENNNSNEENTQNNANI